MANSKTAGIYEALKVELLDGLHLPESKLAIEQLANRFDVSVSAVREALSRLTSDRLVTALPQRGFVVAPVSAKDLLDLTSVRTEIEIKCLKRSIELGSVEWEGRLLSTWHQLSRTQPVVNDAANPEWVRLHARFHDDLISACDSVWWMRVREELYVQAERYRRMILPHKRGGRDVETEHRTILDYALGRNADKACEALGDHLSLTAKILLESGCPLLKLPCQPAEKIRKKA